MNWVVAALAFAAALVAAPTRLPLEASAAESCERLASLTLAHATISLAEVVAPGAFKPSALPAGTPASAAQRFASLPSFCRVAATLAPTSDSDIKIEVWLPVSDWNGKLIGVGNGGWAGTISYPALADSLGRGYATASTDTGHTGDRGTFVLGHPEKFVDFAWRSEHEMTVAAKAIVAAFYGSAARRSYWNGCSTGGRQGLMEAQRFPEDYDGIIAGASANPRTHLNAWQLSLAQALLRDPASYIPPDKYPLIHDAVLNACDALDGVRDRLITDPTRCRFDPQVLACKDADSASCLTAPQVQAVRTVMSPARTRSGVEIFPGHEPGDELGWGITLRGPEPIALTTDHYRYVVFKDPSWDWRTFDLERDVAIADRVDGGTVNASPDVRSFVQRGGKLLMYHGWSDPLVAPRASVNYYTSAVKAIGGPAKASSSIRLFMAPGMGHCRGGEGPDTFDTIGALDDWVEKSRAPERIIASHAANGVVDRTRPLCPFPQVAVYAGTGSTDDAANFVCRAR